MLCPCLESRKMSETDRQTDGKTDIEAGRHIYIYIYINKEEKRLNKLFIRYAQFFGPAAFLGGAKTDCTYTLYIYIHK